MRKKEKTAKKTKKVRMVALFWTSAHVNSFLVLDCSRREFSTKAGDRVSFLLYRFDIPSAINQLRTSLLI